MTGYQRTKNATRNIVFGLLLKIVQIVVPFFMRTAMIYLLGIEYLGLNSLFTSILQVLNLAELGVGSAMTFSMYKPIVEEDNTTICALMNLYKVYYRIIGGIVLVLGLCLLPFIPNLIAGNVPVNINIYVLYILNLSVTVLSYWLYAYKNSILFAHQRVDITSKVVLLADSIKYVFQLFVLFVFKNYYYYIIVMLLTQIITNIITAYMSERLYPKYKPSGKLTAEVKRNINNRIRDLFTSKLGAVIVNSADTIVISAYLGLTILAVYQNYYFILNSIIGFVAVIFTSCTAGIGNSLVVESKEKNYKDLKEITFIISWICGFCSIALLCLYQPFMNLWVGEKLMLDFSIVICLCVYYFIYEINALLNLYKDAAGLWHEDRYRPLITAGSNLILNLILVKVMGLYGVILSTILSTIFIGMPWLIHNLFTILFKMNAKAYIKRLIYYIVITIIGATITYKLTMLIDGVGIVSMILKGISCFIISNTIFYICYCKMDEFMSVKDILNKVLVGVRRIK